MRNLISALFLIIVTLSSVEAQYLEADIEVNGKTYHVTSNRAIHLTRYSIQYNFMEIGDGSNGYVGLKIPAGSKPGTYHYLTTNTGPQTVIDVEFKKDGKKVRFDSGTFRDEHLSGYIYFSKLGRKPKGHFDVSISKGDYKMHAKGKIYEKKPTD